jgi:molecular chaperone GrpE
MAKKENKVSDNEEVPSEENEAAENEAPEEAGDTVAADHTELTALLEDARARADDHWDQYLRLQAEIENLHKRAERDLGNAHKFALERFALELLPVKDSLEMGLNTFDAEADGVSRLKEGVELTLQMLTSAMEKFGITEVNPQDAVFDPENHQAMSMQECEGVAPNTVVTVVAKGYLLNERLIRPAMVIVAKAPAEAEE